MTLHDGTQQDIAEVEKELTNLRFDGSTDVQVVCTIQTKTKKPCTIFVKARLLHGAGQKEAGIKHLYIDEKGVIHFHINGFGMLYG